MLRRIASWTSALVLFLAAVPAALGQEGGAAGDELGIRVGAGYSLWLSDLDFRCESTTKIVDVECSSMSGVEIFGQMEVVEEWSVRLGGDFLFAVDMDCLVGSLSAVYTPLDGLDSPMEVHFRAGILLGSLDMKDVDGDFDPAVGVEAGFGFSYGLDEYLDGLRFQAEAMFRHLRFDFDRDETVTKSDDSIGGFGGRLTLGFVYKF